LPRRFKKVPNYSQRIRWRKAWAAKQVRDQVEKNMKKAARHTAGLVKKTIGRTQPLGVTPGGYVYGLNPSRPGEPPKRVTDAMRNSIGHYVKVEGWKVMGYVFVDVPYGRIHEFGFSGVVTVPAHTRLQSVVFGKRLPAPIKVFVPTHRVHINLPPRPFLRPTIKKAQPKITHILRTGLVRG
jgi:hypothetical protein